MNFGQFFTKLNWWGKLIGAFLGYLIAGPAGALLGVVIGNLFDRGLAIHYSRPYSQYHSEQLKETQAIFFEANFCVMGYIAKADGRVTEAELETAKNIMDELRLTAKQKQDAKRFFNIGKDENFHVERILLMLKKATLHNTSLLRLFVDFQYRLAKTDGLTEKKRQALNRILQYLGFAPLHRQYHTYEDLFDEAFRQYRQRSSSSSSSNSSSSYSSYRNTSSYTGSTIDDAYALLGLNKMANKQEVKKAYRKLISQNHPDKLIAKGLSEAEIKKATDKTQKISKAYEQICESKGW